MKGDKGKERKKLVFSEIMALFSKLTIIAARTLDFLRMPHGSFFHHYYGHLHQRRWGGPLYTVVIFFFFFSIHESFHETRFVPFNNLLFKKVNSYLRGTYLSYVKAVFLFCLLVAIDSSKIYI